MPLSTSRVVGVQGVAARNTMRYFLAIEKGPKQLHEMSAPDDVAMMRGETKAL